MVERLKSPRTLGLLTLGWTLVIWVPRIWIQPVSNAGNVTRLVGSLLIGLAAVWVLFRPGRATRPVLIVFATWTVALWARTLWNYWTLDNPPELRLVHTLLAAGFFLLAWRAIAAAGRNPVSGPDQRDGGQEGDSEGAALAER